MKCFVSAQWGNCFCIRLVRIFILLLLCGCFRKFDKFNTLEDYSDSFDRKQKISLAGRKHLTISEARTIALANNPTLRAAVNSIRSARYSYYRSMSSWMPEVTAAWEVANSHSRGYDLLHPPAGIFPSEDRFSTGGTVRATWLLFDGLARELDILTAKLEYERNVAVADDVKRLLLRAVEYIWCDTLLASEEIIIHRADKEFQDYALKQAEEQFKAGHISYSTVLNFKILSAKAQSRITAAGYNRQTALNTLAALLGCGNGEVPPEIKLYPLSFSAAELNLPLHFYLQKAIINRPDLKAGKAVLEKALRQKQAAYAAFMPQVHLFAGFSFDTASASYGDYPVRRSRYNHPEFSYGITASWNIFRGFHSFNELRKRQALEEVALWGLNKKYLEVTAEVGDALDHCRNAVIQIDIFTDMAEYVQEQRDLIYSEYINGRETVARVNQAQSELVAAQTALALWKIQYCKAASQLNAAVGTALIRELSLSER